MVAELESKGLSSEGKTRWMRCGFLLLVCGLVIGVYAWSATSGLLEFEGADAQHTYYNLLAQGFGAGQLNLKTEAPPGLAQLADPYDPAANRPYRLLGAQPLHDVSYYKGKLFLYFGVTPALLLFWPYAALTGHYLSHKTAVVIFFSAGFLAGAGLLLAMWRRYFAEVKLWIVAVCLMALGLANFIPPVLARCDVYEVAVSCGYALTMLALGAIWQALHQPQRRGRWLAAASLAYGLALGARPSLLFGAVILLAPVIQARREKQAMRPLLAAMTVPIALVGLGLMFYNELRFDNPLEFGQRYQLSSTRQDTAEQFRLRYLWFNLRLDFLEPARWSGHFPFVHEIATPALPKGADQPEHPFGVLPNIPLVWMALCAPLVWRNRSAQAAWTLRRYAGAVALLFGICALTIGLYFIACLRYEVEFAHAVVLLAVAGIFGLERALAGRPVWRRAGRCVWGSLLAFSVAFNLAASFDLHALAYTHRGGLLVQRGRLDEAIAQYRKALAICPDYADALNDMGFAFFKEGDLQAAIALHRKAVEIEPGSATFRYNLGNALASHGELEEAIVQYRLAVEFDPANAEVRNNLGLALFGKGELDQAIAQYNKAIELAPDNARAVKNLGAALYAQGDWDAAITQFHRALEILPDDVEARYSLGVVLFAKGDIEAAIAQYREALETKPDYVEARNHLANAFLTKGDLKEAIDAWQKSLEIAPAQLRVQTNLAWLLATSSVASLRDGAKAAALAEQASQSSGGGDPDILRTLAAACAEQGDFGKAADTAQRALKLALEQKKDALAATLQKEIMLYQANTPLREAPR
jgi:tetratricopeptide (TPR) repeat protein